MAADPTGGADSSKAKKRLTKELAKLGKKKLDYVIKAGPKKKDDLLLWECTVQAPV